MNQLVSNKVTTIPNCLFQMVGECSSQENANQQRSTIGEQSMVHSRDLKHVFVDVLRTNHVADMTVRL